MADNGIGHGWLPSEFDSKDEKMWRHPKAAREKKTQQSWVGCPPAARSGNNNTAAPVFSYRCGHGVRRYA